MLAIFIIETPWFYIRLVRLGGKAAIAERITILLLQTRKIGHGKVYGTNYDLARRIKGLLRKEA